jgi:hypothetical protein
MCIILRAFAKLHLFCKVTAAVQQNTLKKISATHVFKLGFCTELLSTGATHAI